MIRTVATATFMLAAVLALSGASNAAVFGTDERTRLAADSDGLARTIGTLTATNSGSFCTAFCVAPDLIATASHCLFGTATSPGPKLSELRFKLSSSTRMDRGAALAGRSDGSQDHHIISGTRNLAVSPPIGAAEDWAVAKLDRPLCQAQTLPLTTKARAAIMIAAARGVVYNVGFHTDLAGGSLRKSGPCAMERDNSDSESIPFSQDFLAPDAIFLHTCDTGGGSSGSPLLMNTSDGPEVVALNVGTYIRARSVPTARDTLNPSRAGEPIANTAIAVSELAAAVTELSLGRDLAKIDDIRHLQVLLRDNGFYSGEISGHISDRLITAVKRFEVARGIPAHRRLTTRLIADLQNWQRTHGQQIMLLGPVRSIYPPDER